MSQRNAEGGERFPPLLTPVRLREREDAFEEARARAFDAGAGTVFHVGRFDLIEFAVVLEPEQPLAAARRVFFAGMNALAETLATDSPPEVAVTVGYPGGLTLDGGLVGGARLAWPEGAREQDIPDWLVFGAMIRVGGFQELGYRFDPSTTTLEEAGMTQVEPVDFTARFCRHLMVEIDEWLNVGFKGVGARYLARLSDGQDADGQNVAARVIAPNGDLALTDAGGARRTRSFAAEVAAAVWYDPAVAGPRA